MLCPLVSKVKAAQSKANLGWYGCYPEPSKANLGWYRCYPEPSMAKLGCYPEPSLSILGRISGNSYSKCHVVCLVACQLSTYCYSNFSGGKSMPF